MQIPTPTTKKQVREFLGISGHWIRWFAEIAKLLYSAAVGVTTLWELTGEHEWTKEQTFKNFKEALV